MTCKHCCEGKVCKMGIERFKEFCNFANDRCGIFIKVKPCIFKTNGMYFLCTEYYDFRIVACPICGRKF